MALINSPKIVTDGLVYYQDMDNRKSYAGPAIQNLAKSITTYPQLATGISVTGGTETVNIPQLGSTLTYYTYVQNNYTSFTPNSSACCVQLIGGWGGFAVSPSTTYTYAIVYKCDSEYTSPNYMYRYEFTANGGTLVVEAGIHNNSNRIALGDGWYWAWGTFTTQSTTNWIGNSALFYYQYSPFADKVSVAKVLITPGNYTTMHPRYWPEQNTTRTNTQVLSDLTRLNSITASSLTYNNNGTFRFNGTGDYLRPTVTHSYLLSSAIEVIFNSASHGTGFKTIAGYRHNGGYSFPTLGSIYLNGNTLSASLIGVSDGYRTVTSSVTIAQNTNYHVVFNKDTVNGTMQLYVNGILTGTQTFTTANYAQWPTLGSFIGANILDIAKSSNNDVGQGWSADFFNGNIPIVKLYNRTLTATEVQQNFQALRGRYGL